MLEIKRALVDGDKFGVGVKEGAARAVLRDVRQHGHESVELRRDGRRVIFFCTLCSTRCYSDAALADHLKGNQHSRRSLAASAFAPLSEKACSSDVQTASAGEPEQFVGRINGKTNNNSPALSLSVLESNSASAFPPSSLEWIGSGQILLKEAQSEASRLVKAVRCQWVGRSSAEASDAQTNGATEKLAYSVVIFPYSDAIGRSGNWKPLRIIKKSSTTSKENVQTFEFWKKGIRSVELNSRPAIDQFAKENISSQPIGDYSEKEAGQGGLVLSKNLSQRELRKALKRRRLNALERLCFICHQQMLPGKDVAAILNPKTGQMMCSSRNTRGAFHVFHTSCLIDWILLCEAKFWSARSICCIADARGMRGQINVKQQRGRTKATAGSNGLMFCPECQGTGAKFQGNQLEEPRYRLAQVFEWILELIQARRSRMDHPEQQMSSAGLLFPSDLESGGKVLPLGFVQFYAAGSLDFLAASALLRSPFSSEISV